MFENRELRNIKIFRPKRGGITRELRRRHKEELCYLYSSSNIIRVSKSRRIKIGRACSTFGGEERCVQGIGGET